MLSPRVLYFAGDELIWECHARLDCECGSLRTTTYAFGRAQLLEPKIDQLDSWTEVLRQYTALSLTYPSDAFPALSGIAKAYQKVYSDTYVAGIWAKCLPEMLLWYFRTSPDILNINTDPWRAPSWSWASQNWNRDLELLPCQESVAKVKDILCEPSGVDPTGQLATAHLTLMTKALSGSLLLVKGRDAPQYILKLENGYEITQAPNHDLLLTDIETQYFGLSDPRLAGGMPFLDVVMAQIGHYWGEHYIFRHKAFDTEGPTEKHITSCLLLAQHPDYAERWVRVGVAAVTDTGYELAFQDVKVQNGYESDSLSAGSQLMKNKLWIALEKREAQARELFQQFEDAPMQEFVVW